MDTGAGGETGISQSRHKKGHLTNIYLTDSDEEPIVDDDKASELFKDKARKKCL